MTLSELLAEAPAGRHFGQLYRALEPLGQAVGTFVDTGLERGKGVLLIATPEHRELFLDGLSDAGRDPGAYQTSGQLAVLDADQMLGRFMDGDLPDWDDFRRTMLGVSEELARFGWNAVRAYGEMVDILWRAARTDAAVMLERFWNEFAAGLSLSIFCAHRLPGHSDAAAGAIHELCREHSDVILTAPGAGAAFEVDPRNDPRQSGGMGFEIGELVDLSGCSERQTRLWLMGDLPGGDQAS